MRSRVWENRILVCLIALCGVLQASAVQISAGALPSAQGAQGTFAYFEQWKDAVVSGNAAVLQALYSTNPPARINPASGGSSADADVAFWSGLKIRRMKANLVQSSSPQTGLQQVVFQLEIHTSSSQSRALYISAAQLWQQQGDQWRIVAGERSDPAKLQQPLSTNKNIYGSSIDARTEIKQALSGAAKEHKRVLVVFGANWCYDCHVLDLAFERADISAVLKRDYKVVHVDVGEGDKNQDLMSEYDVPMKRGIPAAAVLDGNGKLLVSQKNGEFEKARALGPEDLLRFLNQWKPQAR
jgi:thioredoxin 1